jgi:hypothetical protein
VVAHFRCRPSPVTGVSFTKHTTRTVFVRCYKLESLCAGARRNGAQVRVLTARLTFGCGPFAVSKGKRQSVAEHAQIDETKGGRWDSRPAQCLPSADGGLSDCFPKRAQSPSTRPCPRGLHRAEGLVRLVLRCVVLYWYTSCSSSNLPSSEYAGQDHSVKSGRPSSVGMCDPNSKGFSLIDPNQPRCAEFFRGGETPEPLHPDHIRVKRPVCPQVFF